MTSHWHGLDSLTVTEILARSRTSNYSAMSALAFTFWDIVITFDDMVATVWTKRWNVTSTLCVVIQVVSLTSQSRDEHKRDIDQYSDYTLIAMPENGQDPGCCWCVLDNLIVVALYSDKPHLKVVLWALWTAELAVIAAVFDVVANRMQFGPHLCHVTSIPGWYSVLFALPLSVEVPLFMLTMVKFRQSLREGWFGSPIVSNFMRDGLWAFTLPLLSVVANILCVPLLVPVLASVAYPWQIAVSGFVGYRLVLHLRKVQQQVDAEEEHRPESENVALDTVIFGITASGVTQFCAWVYANEKDWGSKILAIERLSAWKSITTLPHALESLLSLLTVVLQDHNQLAATSSLSLRQSYATAVIRLVNGLVDPLQVGAYARSIASIAVQLGLPAWLVELRHAATHEDLPSLELLREAAKESLNWLLHNYLLPTLNPSVERPPPITALRPLSPTLKQYKTLLKSITRDASLRPQYQAEVTKILRDIERWVAEAKVAANVTTSGGWELGDTLDDTADEDDSKELWALERLCDELLSKGMLVPMSKKKRAVPNGPLTPPPTLISLWTPLLDNIRTLHPSFPAVLTSHIIAHLIGSPSGMAPDPEAQAVSSDAVQDDPSYDVCLASWAVWSIESQAPSHLNSDPAPPKEDAFFLLANGLGPQFSASEKPKLGARTLLKALCANDPRLTQISAALLSSSRPPEADMQQWDETYLDVMDERLKAVLALPSDGSAHAPRAPGAEPAREPPPDTIGLPHGWRLLSERTGWKPRPIGVYD
ncbi:Las1-domain-containing protein [Artomyces pyxidatus]|uniref:Las1-domain-containing protein n=1 Tax=Artomyces pyxidatus TaxID=48021 RepID=A0ACB8T4K4_9AGAM|nr:Las1-domain-containing protein [Artomyces pyxidatus]